MSHHYNTANHQTHTEGFLKAITSIKVGKVHPASRMVNTNFINMEFQIHDRNMLTKIKGHLAVCLEHYILVFGGKGRFFRDKHIIWMYNLYTEKWRKEEVPDWTEAPPSCYKASAVVIDTDVYMFDGRKVHTDNPMDALWKLTRDSEGTLFWNRISQQILKEVPPRHWDHSGWEYESKMWIFGGIVFPQDDFSPKYCDQLHCFNHFITAWTNPKCSGSMPAPRAAHATTQVRNKVWLYGGTNFTTTSFDDLYELNMHSLSWTQIQTDLPKPQGRYRFSFNAVTESKIVLHGGFALDSSPNQLSDTWILDMESQSWTQYTLYEDHKRCNHTGTMGLNAHVIIIGGVREFTFYPTTHVMLEPKSLQQLGIQTIDEHKTLISWQGLPNKLIAKLGWSQMAKWLEQASR